jgi:hypothetical protein
MKVAYHRPIYTIEFSFSKMKTIVCSRLLTLQEKNAKNKKR